MLGHLVEGFVLVIIWLIEVLELHHQDLCIDSSFELQGCSGLVDFSVHGLENLLQLDFLEHIFRLYVELSLEQKLYHLLGPCWAF